MESHTEDDRETGFISRNSPLEDMSIHVRESSLPTRLACFLVVELTGEIDSKEKFWTPLLNLEWQQSPLDFSEHADRFAERQCNQHNAKGSYLVSVGYTIHQQQSPEQPAGLTRHYDTFKRQRDDRVLSARSQGYRYIMHSRNTLTNTSQWKAAWEEQFPRSIAKALIEVDHAVYVVEMSFRYQVYTEHVPSSCEGSRQCFNEIIETLDIQSATTHQQHISFIPTQFFDVYFTEDVVHHILSNCNDGKSEWELPRLDPDTRTDFVDKIWNFGCRLLAICIHTKIGLGRLYELYKFKVGDSDLPVIKSGRQLVLSSDSCRAMPKWPANERNLFYNEQFTYCAHQFHDKSDDKKFVRVETDMIMPFLEMESLPAASQGSYGHVSFVKIHEQHHEFSNDRSQLFAVKTFEKQKHEDFKKELAICQELASLPHDHLDPYLSAWEDDKTFNILFPKADCDLHAYLMKASSPGNVSQRLPWFLDQLLGLSEALASIHHLGTPGRSQSDTNSQSATSTGRRRILCHHDLKPGNILVFRDCQGRETMKIGDFGLARIKEKTSRDLASPRTKTRIGTWEYQSPEKPLTRNSSRLSDVWSLGCIFLDMLLWFFDDTQNLEEFRVERAKQPTKGEHTQTMQAFPWYEFWHLPSSVPAQDLEQPNLEQSILGRVVLKYAVSEKLSWLKLKAKESKKEVLIDLIELVSQDMLRPDPAARQCASAVCSQLKNLSWRTQRHINDRVDQFAEIPIAGVETVEISTDVCEVQDDCVSDGQELTDAQANGRGIDTRCE